MEVRWTTGTNGWRRQPIYTTDDTCTCYGGSAAFTYFVNFWVHGPLRQIFQASIVFENAQKSLILRNPLHYDLRKSRYQDTIEV